MIQTNGSGGIAANTGQSGTSQQRGSWFARHTQDVSDASLAEFEQLMAFMGYRRCEPANRATSGNTLAARGG